MYGPGLSISDMNLGIFYMLAVSSLATYGILLAGFFKKFFHNENYGFWPKWISRKAFNKSTWSEGCFISKSVLTNNFSFLSGYLLAYLLTLKHQRSTTKFVYYITFINILVGLGVFILFILFLNIIIRHDVAWFNLNFYMLHILIDESFFLYVNQIKPIVMINRVSVVRPIRLSSGKLSIHSIIIGRCCKAAKSLFFHNCSLCSNGAFKYSYSTKAKSTFAENSKREFNYLPDEIKALHTLYIKDLYKDRIAPVIPFDTDLILDSCNNFSNVKERTEFLKKWGSKGGIYLIQYKHNPLIYYIGRTTLFKRRFNNHIQADSNSKFHLFFKLVGLEYLKFSIIEVCSPNEQGMRENFYLQKFLPLLNSTFSSSFSESDIYTSLTDKLKSLKSETLSLEINSNQPIPVFVYCMDDTSINKKFVKYNSMAEVIKKEEISYNTLLLFRDTNVPFRNKLYLTRPIIDFENTFDKTQEILREVKLYENTPKTVWAYDAKTL